VKGKLALKSRYKLNWDFFVMDAEGIESRLQGQTGARDCWKGAPPSRKIIRCYDPEKGEGERGVVRGKEGLR